MKTPARYTTFKGIEVPVSMKLTTATKKVLTAVKETGACEYERDDSPVGYETQEQLREICYNIGWQYIQNVSGYICLVVSDSIKRIH